jgi:hypothetical protein
MEQCIRLENDIQKPFVNTYITVGVFIDFQKAFDMLWKHGLLQKMVSLNIYGNMLTYVNVFLSNRTLQVRINNTCYKNPHVEHHLLILSRSCCILFCKCFKLGPHFHIAPSSAN